jgi:hypothetical protein
MQESNPEFRGLNFNAELHAYRRPPKGWSSHPQRVIQGFLTNRAFLSQTNGNIVATVAEWFAPYKPSDSIMYRPLHPFSRVAIQAMLDQHGKKIVVRPRDTLSTLKKAIKAGHRVDAKAPTAGTLEISEDFVVANGQPYTIDKSRQHPSIRVTVDGKRQYLRCDLLQALLEDHG